MTRRLIMIAALLLSLTAYYVAAQQITGVTPASTAPVALSAAAASDAACVEGTSCLTLNMGGYGNGAVSVSANASANTLQFEVGFGDAGNPAGATFYSLTLTPAAQTAAVSSITTTGMWQGPIGGQFLRVRLSTLVGGTTTVQLRGTLSAYISGSYLPLAGGTLTGTLTQSQTSTGSVTFKNVSEQLTVQPSSPIVGKATIDGVFGSVTYNNTTDSGCMGNCSTTEMIVEGVHGQAQLNALGKVGVVTGLASNASILSGLGVTARVEDVLSGLQIGVGANDGYAATLEGVEVGWSVNNGTAPQAYGIRINNPTITGTGSYGDLRGITIGAMTGATVQGIGLYIAQAQNNTLWLAGDTSNLSEGITFGSAKDTGIYRVAAGGIGIINGLSGQASLQIFSPTGVGGRLVSRNNPAAGDLEFTDTGFTAVNMTVSSLGGVNVNRGQLTASYVSSAAGAAAMQVANVGANSCGTTAATIAGNSNAFVVTVGATSGTQCRVAFPVAATTEWDCAANDDTTTIAVRVTPVDTTHTDVLGAFVAGDKVSGICFAR